MNKEDLYFLDGNVRTNQYDPINDIVLIDENLDDYALAKEYIIDHEIQHQENRFDLVSDIVHEFRNDWFMEFSFSEEAIELREYFGDEMEDVDMFFYFKTFVMKFLRNTWALFLVPLGSIYRKIYKWRNDL